MAVGDPLAALHPDARELAARIAEAGLRPLIELTPEEARGQVAAMREAMGIDASAPGGPDQLEIEGRDGPLTVLVYTPAEPALGVVVFAHGGGWVLCTPADADPLCRRLVASTGCVIVSVDYRLVPEHPFPAPVDDVLDATLWAAGRWPEKPLLLAGESAGGNLAAAVALRLTGERRGLLAGQVLIYPVTDHDLDTPSYAAQAESPFLTRDDMVWFWGHYAPTDELRAHPWVSPLRADALEGVAPAVVVLAGQDPLHDEGAAYAEALRDAGVPVTELDYEDLPHGFLSMLDALPAAEEPYAQVVAATQQLLVDAPAA